jgi:hypothetical protein
MEGEIRIEDSPFEELIRAAWETRDIDSDGYLFGETILKKTKSLWIIHSVHPTQLADRTPLKVIPKKGAERAEFFLFHKPIGEFHSHVDSILRENGEKKKIRSRLYLTKADFERLNDEKYEIEIVIGVRKTNRVMKLQYNPYLISSYMVNGAPYRFDISGYYIDGGKRRAKMTISEKASKEIGIA